MKRRATPRSGGESGAVGAELRTGARVPYDGLVGRVRVEVQQTGGFGGLSLHDAVDSEQLTPDAAAELERLADALERAAASAPPPRSVPDAAHYDVRIARDRGTQQLRFSDVTAPPELRALLAHVASESRRDQGSDPGRREGDAAGA